MNKSTRTITFTVDSAEEKKSLYQYARSKKFRTIADFCRFAINQYQQRYPARRTGEALDCEDCKKRLLALEHELKSQGCTAQGL